MHEEPVEILVGMAESGEIDPWNIDIVEVTDRFLGELERMKELDLRISGRTLFFASTLLRMKSEYLEEADEEEEIEFEGDALFDDFGFDADSTFEDFSEPIERLEREIKRRVGRKGKRRRPVTLYELIKELKTAEKMERRRTRRKSPVPELLLEADDIVSVAHEEDFQDVTETVYASFERMEEDGKDVTTLHALSRGMGRDVRTVYLPLLFLMLEGRLMIWQDEFFGDIYVSRWRADAFED
jgi:segregation and condensation protein A